MFRWKIFLTSFAILTTTLFGGEMKEGKIVVIGEGKVVTSPDIVEAVFAVETQAKTAATAAAENARITNAVISNLKQYKSGKGQLFTLGYSISPIYGRDPGSTATKITGFRVLNSVKIITNKTDKTGDIIDAAITAGANRVNTLIFSISEREKYFLQALKMASLNAKKRAEAIADSLGIKLKNIEEASIVDTYHTPPMPQMRTMVAEDRISTPILAGDVTVEAKIKIVFSIQQ